MLPLRFHLYIWFPIACQKELVRKAGAQAQSSLHIDVEVVVD
jgi:hypothetical protein